MADLSQIVVRMAAAEHTVRRQELLIGSSAYWQIVSRVSAAAYLERYAYLSLEIDELVSEVAVAAARRIAAGSYPDAQTLRLLLDLRSMNWKAVKLAEFPVR